jgi:hypothetical protein
VSRSLTENSSRLRAPRPQGLISPRWTAVRIPEEVLKPQYSAASSVVSGRCGEAPRFMSGPPACGGLRHGDRDRCARAQHVVVRRRRRMANSEQFVVRLSVAAVMTDPVVLIEHEQARSGSDPAQPNAENAPPPHPTQHGLRGLRHRSPHWIRRGLRLQRRSR